METWTTAQAAEHCGVTATTLRSHWSRHGGPAPLPYRDDHGSRLYRADDVRAWHANRPGRGKRTDLHKADTAPSTAPSTPRPQVGDTSPK
ncbi:hypothetical protein [Alloactinosynnema sp. L-07]|uniref:hypothetical protein n=1 Tax=Alloactinosynnema sp. L-07 TaxID=1653480 RepID=UPI00065F0A42|nr:hypothetical protein [Alloactinosynnema sp. L-07]CRK59094.1 hypothetical protein [Alloactinosynnema sp. L-07]